MVEVERLGGPSERVEEEAAEEWAELVRARERSEHRFLARPIREVARERGAQIGRDQELLELSVESLVDRALRVEDRAQPAR